MADEDYQMSPAEIQMHSPMHSPIAPDKRRAVPGAERAKMDELQENVAYYKLRLKDEMKRRKDIERELATAEKAAAEAQKIAAEAENIAAEGAQMELHRYVETFEADSQRHFDTQHAVLIAQLKETESTVVQLKTTLASAAEACEAQQHQLTQAQQMIVAQEEAEVEYRNTFQAASRDFADQSRRLTEAEASLVAQKQAYEKEIAEKSTEILALMAKLRTGPTSTAATPEKFPGTSPPLIPRFLSTATRKQRVVDKVIKTSSNRIPVIPLQVPSPAEAPSSQIRDQLETFDPQNDESIDNLTNAVRQVLAGMGIVQVDVHGGSKKKKSAPKRGPSQMAAAVRTQQAALTQEQDQLYKRGLRETWRTTYNIATADGFKHYAPVPPAIAAACNDGGEGPAPSEYTLDFSDGFMSNIWNKIVIDKLVRGFQAARAASYDDWGLPAVSDAYLKGELYGHLKCSQQAWAIWQPRFLPALLRMETEAEAFTRAEGYRGKRQTTTASRSTRENKFKRRLGTVTKILEIKTVQGAADLELWEFFKTMVGYLDVDGMSSEDAEVRDFGGRPVNSFVVRLCVWRAPPIVDYLRIIDDAGQSMKRTNAGPRFREGGAGRSAPPKGLPRKMYDETWLSKQHANYVEDLEISGDAFEFLVAATRSM